MAQPNRNQIPSQQCRVRRFFSVKTCSERANCFHFACADVHEPCRLSTLRRPFQRTWLERMLYSAAIPLFACPSRLLEWRTCDYLRSDPQCGGGAPERNGSASIDECIARTRQRRIRRARHQLRWMDRCIARDG